MKAEERLKKKYEKENPIIDDKYIDRPLMRLSQQGAMYVAAEDIDLIADLVVERLALHNDYYTKEMG